MTVRSTGRLTLAIACLAWATAATAANPPALKQAFAAAYPKAVVPVRVNDTATNRMRFSPALLVPLPQGRYALVSKGQNVDDTCHGCDGAYSVAHLKQVGSRLTLEAPPFAQADSDSGFGAPPKLELFNGLAAEPVLSVRGSHEGMGSVERWQSLIRLGGDARATKVAATFPVGLTVRDEHNKLKCAMSAKLAPMAADQSITLTYTGALQRQVRYAWSGDRWTARNAVKDMEQLYDFCPK